MARRRDRQQLREALHEPEHERLPARQRARLLAHAEERERERDEEEHDRGRVDGSALAHRGEPYAALRLVDGAVAAGALAAGQPRQERRQRLELGRA